MQGCAEIAKFIIFKLLNARSLIVISIFSLMPANLQCFGFDRSPAQRAEAARLNGTTHFNTKPMSWLSVWSQVFYFYYLSMDVNQVSTWLVYSLFRQRCSLFHNISMSLFMLFTQPDQVHTNGCDPGVHFVSHVFRGGLWGWQGWAVAHPWLLNF